MRSGRWAQVGLGVIISAMLVLLVSGCSGSTGTTGGGTGGTGTGGGTTGAGTVVEKNFQFTPSSLTIKVGDKVTFSNQDSVPHHVVIGTADLGEQQPGQDVIWTADKDGVFPLKCTIHRSMTGQITVGSAGSAAPPDGGTGTGGSSAPPAGGTSSGSGAPPPSGGYGY